MTAHRTGVFALSFLAALLVHLSIASGPRPAHAAGDVETDLVTAALDSVYALAISETYDPAEDERVGRVVRAAIPVVMARLGGWNESRYVFPPPATIRHAVRAVLSSAAQLGRVRENGEPESEAGPYYAHDLSRTFEGALRLGDARERRAVAPAYNLLAALEFVAARRRFLQNPALVRTGRASFDRLQGGRRALILQANYELVGVAALRTPGGLFDTRRVGTAALDASSVEIARHALRLLVAGGTNETRDPVQGAGTIEGV